MNEFTKGVQNKIPWCIMLADYVGLVNENTNMLEGKLERWREVLENIRLKISWAKTEFVELRSKNKVVKNWNNHYIRIGGY